MADDSKPAQTLSSKLAMAGALTLAMIGSLVVGPKLFPKAPGQGFSIGPTLCAALGGGLGALLGNLIGRLIEKSPGKDRQ